MRHEDDDFPERRERSLEEKQPERVLPSEKKEFQSINTEQMNSSTQSTVKDAGRGQTLESIFPTGKTSDSKPKYHNGITYLPVQSKSKDEKNNKLLQLKGKGISINSPYEKLKSPRCSSTQNKFTFEGNQNSKKDKNEPSLTSLLRTGTIGTVSSQRRPSTRYDPKQSVLVNMTNKMVLDLEQRSRKFTEPLRLSMRPSSSSSEYQRTLEESRTSNEERSSRYKQTTQAERLNPDSALKIDVMNWRAEHERSSKLLKKGIINRKGNRIKLDESIEFSNTEASKKTDRSDRVNRSMNLTNYSPKIPTQQRFPTYGRSISGSKESQLNHPSLTIESGIKGNSFGKAERPPVFQTKHVTGPGPVYNMTYYNGISQSRKAPKIDRASHDRSELLLTHETTPSPQHYYQNREFEKDAFKAPSPIFGYQRNSLKKKVWEDRLKQISKQKERDTPTVPFYNVKNDFWKSTHGSFARDRHREIFKFDKNLPGPGNYDPKLETFEPRSLNQTQTSFGRAKRRTDPTNFPSISTRIQKEIRMTIEF